jgi:CxxC-x17-CxxC domain-containing protein
MEKQNNRRKSNDSSKRGRLSQGTSERYDSVCSSCGKECQVPFKPIKGKPVLCVNCYKKDNTQDQAHGEKYKAVCSECGKECEVPFKPNGRKPVLCSKCYAEEEDDFDFDDIPKKDNGQIDTKLNVINTKLDEIIRMLGIVSSTDKDFDDKIKKSKKKIRKDKNRQSIKRSKKSKE